MKEFKFGRLMHLFCLTMGVLFLTLNLAAQEISIIPKPMEMEVQKGKFVFDKDVALQYDEKDQDIVGITDLLSDYVKQLYGFSLKKRSARNTIRFKIDKNLDLGKEAYLLKVNGTGISITTSSPNGLFYGMQSLRQMLPIEISGGKVEIPQVNIRDNPRFSWRGNMLDVGRYFFTVSFLKKYLDILAMYKINIFHWHLTEDQGWRIEIKKYPKLTEIGAWRKETAVGHTKNYDGKRYGGYYTQEQIREIVAYAKERYITIVPEIEMPGHATAALASYPELGCTGGPYEVSTHWGVHDDVFCAGKETTFEFLENVLSEVIALFPGEYIHIGGDECPKERWKTHSLDQARIRKEGLRNEEELQAYFIRRIGKFLYAHGKKMIGWDEILEGGLAPGAAVMSWRGVKGGIAAARKHHDVVMSPLLFMYFNLYQAKDTKQEPIAFGKFLPLEKVYNYEPVPKELSADEAKYVLGVQSNLWTEYISDSTLAEYMLLPRLQAEAEVAWTPQNKKDFTGFKKRLLTDYKRLKKLEINYRDYRK